MARIAAWMAALVMALTCTLPARADYESGQRAYDARTPRRGIGRMAGGGGRGRPAGDAGSRAAVPRRSGRTAKLSGIPQVVQPRGEPGVGGGGGGEKRAGREDDHATDRSGAGTRGGMASRNGRGSRRRGDLGDPPRRSGSRRSGGAGRPSGRRRLQGLRRVPGDGGGARGLVHDGLACGGGPSGGRRRTAASGDHRPGVRGGGVRDHVRRMGGVRGRGRVWRIPAQRLGHGRGPPAGGFGELERRPALCAMVEQQDGSEVSTAERVGMGVRGSRGDGRAFPYRLDDIDEARRTTTESTLTARGARGCTERERCA